MVGELRKYRPRFSFFRNGTWDWGGDGMRMGGDGVGDGGGDGQWALGNEICGLGGRRCVVLPSGFTLRAFGMSLGGSWGLLD